MPGKKQKRVSEGNWQSTNNSANEDDTVGEILNDVTKQQAASMLEAIDQLKSVVMKFGESITEMNKTIQRLNDRLDKTETELLDTKQARDKLEDENGKLKTEVETLSAQNEMLHIQLETEAEMKERHQRRFNIKINGMNVGAKKKEEVIEEVLKLVNDNNSDGIKGSDIYDVHVIKTHRGQQLPNTSNRGDTVIVSLQNVEMKKTFYHVSKKMQESGSQIYIGDDLTLGQRNLLYKLKQRKDLYNKVQFRNGSVRCQKKDGSWSSFSYLHELKRLPQIPASSSSNST